MGDRLTAIVFDLDGTLIDSLADLHAATNHALASCRLPTRSLDEVRCAVGDGVGKLMERSIEGGVGNPLYGRCLETFRRYYAQHDRDMTVPYAGVMDMLEALSASGYTLAIVSNKFDAAVADLAHHFFAGLVDVAIGEREGRRRKPAPDLLDDCLRLLDRDRAHALYVGDSDTDIEFAHAAGVKCVSVAWGFRSREFLIEHGATLIADDPAHLRSIIDGIGPSSDPRNQSARTTSGGTR